MGRQGHDLGAGCGVSMARRGRGPLAPWLARSHAVLQSPPLSRMDVGARRAPVTMFVPFIIALPLLSSPRRDRVIHRQKVLLPIPARPTRSNISGAIPTFPFGKIQNTFV